MAVSTMGGGQALSKESRTATDLDDLASYGFVGYPGCSSQSKPRTSLQPSAVPACTEASPTHPLHSVPCQATLGMASNCENAVQL